MDLEQARTFLAVAETGSFVDAAARLNVTQSTVSARIKTLEEQLGQSLFTRGRGGAQATPSGEQFKRHAAALVRVWDHARQEVGLPAAYRSLLKIGGQQSFWDNLLLDWTCWMRRRHPRVALRTEAASADRLMELIGDGLLDLVVMYNPQNRAGLTVERLFEDRLIAVASTPGAGVGVNDYIYEDWGNSFALAHAEMFPALSAPALSDGIGGLGLNVILAQGGAGYFPLRLTKAHIEAGRLYAVKGAPTFDRPVYAVHAGEADDETLAAALKGLRRLARKLGQLRI